MFTLEQIHSAHDKVKSGADFPAYIQEIKELGVTAFETWVIDSHTVYFGEPNVQIQSEAQYPDLVVSDHCDKAQFIERLKVHQSGKTDYFQFCQDCAATGILKWVVDLKELTCIYFDKKGNEIWLETIPS